MVVIKEVSAKAINDSRGEKTISVTVKTNVGNFTASSPTGKSTGKFEKNPYIKDIDGDVKTLKNCKDYFSGESIESFSDLRRIEDVVDRHIGANSLFALESAVLKAVAKEQKKEVWELINPNQKKIPRLVGNCIGGGKHSQINKKPDFQEFLLIPNLNSVKQMFEKNKSEKKEVSFYLKRADKNFNGEKNDENAWMTALNDKEVLDILKNTELPIGIDVASSGFMKRKMYYYENPMLKRNPDEQFNYICNLIGHFDIFYIEDPFSEEEFESFAKLLKKFPNKLIVGDDLTVTNYKRLEKAIEKKSISAVIVKPNQCGSLLEVKQVCEIARQNKIKIIFSHRSGETNETILADLAFGFGADFFKCGIDGKEREVKIKRLVQIEKSLK